MARYCGSPDRAGHGGLRHQVPLPVPLRVSDLQVPQEKSDDRGDESHDQGDFDDPVHREEERLEARTLRPHTGDDEEDAETDDAREERFADPADSQETVRSLESIVVPRHGRLGLWHDCSESPGREEDCQVLRYVIYSRSQVKPYASNLQRDFILESYAGIVVGPRSGDGHRRRSTAGGRHRGGDENRQLHPARGGRPAIRSCHGATTASE